MRALDHVVLNVTDAEEALAWYRDRLGLAAEREDEWRRGEAPFVSVRVDDGTVLDLLAAGPDAPRLDHLCLVVDGVDLDALAADDAFDVARGPSTVWGARGWGRSVYVRDPAGNLVELRTYET